MPVQKCKQNFAKSISFAYDWMEAAHPRQKQLGATANFQWILDDKVGWDSNVQ